MRSQLLDDMSVLPFQVGLRYNGCDIAFGAKPSAGAVPGR